jgi:hypothetical protein
MDQMGYRTARRSAFAFAGLALAVGACSSASYDRDETIQELVDEGLTEDIATCVVDGMEDQIGVDRLDDTGDPTDEEIAIITDITTDCMLGG